MKTETMKKVWAAATAIVVGIALILFGERVVGWEIHGLLASITLGMIIVTFSVFLWELRKKREEKKAGVPVKDERIKYVEGRAAYYSLMVGAYFMLGLLWYSFLGVKMLDLPELETSPAMIISLLVIIGLYAALRWYLDKKGDVE
ncbi:MAG: hypothetical protein U9N35_05700 [Euryarchaeota archaeon]|nr:hypothetical protein [Euryarchaeota archaeon]